MRNQRKLAPDQRENDDALQLKGPDVAERRPGAIGCSGPAAIMSEVLLTVNVGGEPGAAWAVAFVSDNSSPAARANLSQE